MDVHRLLSERAQRRALLGEEVASITAQLKALGAERSSSLAHLRAMRPASIVRDRTDEARRWLIHPQDEYQDTEEAATASEPAHQVLEAMAARIPIEKTE